MTLANKITFFRLFLTLVYFVVLGFAMSAQDMQMLLDVSFGLFLVVGFLDLVDGYVARRYNESTNLGRILDPLVDKIMTCGSFVYFVTLVPVADIIQPWIPVVIIVREFAVHAVRLDIEASGMAFGASFWGKQKTFIQNIAAGGCLVYSAHMHGRLAADTVSALRSILIALVYLAVISTVVSGIIYLLDAARVLAREKTRV